MPEKNWKLLSADYSQIELRILAHLADEEILINAFHKNDDIHSLTARLIFEKEEISSEERRVGKTINFGVIYGMGIKKFARSTGVSTPEAKEFLIKYKEKISFELSQKKLKFSEALGNDLNTAGAIAIIYDLAKPLKNFLNQFQRVEGFKIDLNEKFFLLENFKTLEKLTEVLGLKKEVLVKESKITEEEISTLINERSKAKKEKNYTKADEIRNLLKEKGIELIDQSKEITTWIRI